MVACAIIEGTVRQMRPIARGMGAEMEPDRAHFADLMEAVAQRQDRAAFAELFAHFAPRVKGYLLRIGAGEALAEELAQEVMVTVWRKAGLYERAQAAVSTWIFRIARNRRIDAARREAAHRLDPDDAPLPPTEFDAPDEAASANERAARVRAALERLPGEQVSLLRAAYYEGLSHSDIAARAKLPLGTVKSRLRLAFARLRTDLDGEV